MEARRNELAEQILGKKLVNSIDKGGPVDVSELTFVDDEIMAEL